MRIARRLLNSALALSLAATFAISAHGVSSARQAPAGMPTIRLGYLENNPQWAPTLDPAVVEDQNSSYLTQLLYGGLINIKQVGGRVVPYPQLASRYKVTGSGKIYTFSLRKTGFANGDPLTAQDVVFSIRRALSKQTNSPINTYDSMIKGFANYSAGKSSYLGVKALNARTVQFTLSVRAGFFPEVLAYPLNFILDAKVMRGTSTNSGGTYLTTTCKAAAAGASGPFKAVCHSSAANDVTSFYPGGSTPTLTLVPNSHFYQKAHVRLVIPAIDSNQTGLRDFRSGGLDETFGVPTQDQATYRGKPGAYQFPTAFIEYLGMNVNDPPFSNVHCRLAVAYAIDRVTLAKKYLHGAYKPLYSFVPGGFQGYFNGHSGVPYYDPAKARQQLAKCPGGINVTYVYRNDTTDRNAEAAAITAMLATVGIHFTPKGVPRSEWLNYIARDTPLSKTHTAACYGDWFEDYPDSQDYFYNLLYGGVAENFSGYNNKTFNKLIDEADAAANQSTRARLYLRANKMMLNQAPVVPYDNGTAFDLVNTKKVHGLIPDNYRAVTWAKNNDWANVS
ncbi:MAG TPA: peptide ABC transporter substrate-binding protein [Chloroflexota bacterium]|nr:peptide ABC transporter substrate-binding protein [Chloroflexota bacterium]